MWAVIAVALMCAVAGPRPAHAAGADSTITTIGVSSQFAFADRASLTIQVNELGKNNDKLKRRLDLRIEQTKRIIDSIGGASIQTTNGASSDLREPYKNRYRVIGISQYLTIASSDMRRFIQLRAVLDSLEGVALRGVEYALSDDRAENDQLLELAAADAQRQAVVVADELDVALGPPVEVIVSPSLQEVQQYLSTRQNTQLYWDLRNQKSFNSQDEELPMVKLSAAVKVRFVMR